MKPTFQHGLPENMKKILHMVKKIPNGLPGQGNCEKSSNRIALTKSEKKVNKAPPDNFFGFVGGVFCARRKKTLAAVACAANVS